MTIPEIIASIDRRLVELGSEIQRLEQARVALAHGTELAPAHGTESAPALPRPSRPSRRPARRRPRPAAEVVPVDKLLSVLAGTEGMTTSELAAVTSGRPPQILALLKEQESAGEIRRTGVRRSTRWHLVTDEDRVAARAAELADRSRGGGPATAA